MNLVRQKFRVRGDVIEVHPAYEEAPVRIEMFGDEIEAITMVDPVTGERVRQLEELLLFPATHYATSTSACRRRSSASRPSCRNASPPSSARASCSRRSASACAPATTSR